MPLLYSCGMRDTGKRYELPREASSKLAEGHTLVHRISAQFTLVVRPCYVAWVEPNEMSLLVPPNT